MKPIWSPFAVRAQPISRALPTLAAGIAIAVCGQACDLKFGNIFGPSGPATSFEFVVGPSTVRPGAVITPAVEVALSNLSLGYTATDSIALRITNATGTPGAVLGGTITRGAVNGRATFTDLTVNKAGAAYRLSATFIYKGGVTAWSANSRAFNVTGPATHVVITPASPSLTVLGDNLQLTAEALDADNMATGDTAFAWTSSDPATVRVSATGLVTAAAYGTATIRATTGALSGSASVAVAVMVGKLASLSAGDRNTCGVTSTGAAYCWGGRDVASADSNTVLSQAAPWGVAGDLRFSSVSAGTSHVCGVATSGVVYCWGLNDRGQLGTGGTVSSTGPVEVAGGLSFAAASAGGSHSCGVTTDGAAYCWGANYTGQLGTDSAPGLCWTTPCAQMPTPVNSRLAFQSITAGLESACGVTTTGAAYCWGANYDGQLGDGSDSERYRSTPVVVSGGLTFASLSAGSDHTCGVTTNGAAYCWGYNAWGELGSATGTYGLVPVAVTGGLAFSAVSAGGVHTCGVTADGVAYCWGVNYDGELGDGSTSEFSRVPVAVAGGLRFASVSAGGRHTCGVTTDGVAYCWGLNDHGQLGTGGTVSSSTPVRVAGQP